MILQSKEIQTAVLEISCNGKTGTAFNVKSTDNEHLLLTAYHVVSQHVLHPVQVKTTQHGELTEIQAVVVKYNLDEDIAILKLNHDLPDLNILPLVAKQVAYGSKWETFGFPAAKIEHGGRYNGTISSTIQGSVWDIDLSCDQTTILPNFDGLSGAPLVVDGYVVGIISYQLSHSLGATSLWKCKETLDQCNVNYVDTESEAVPISIEEDISDTKPNQHVLDQLSEVVDAQPDNNYFLISGNPGSGKTTLAAQWNPNPEKYDICDRYFVKVPDQDPIPTQIRATPEYFLKWLEDVYCRILLDQPAEKSEKQLNARILDIHNGLARLGTYYQSIDKTGILIIDGLDDISPEKIDTFFEILPRKLSKNLKVILLGTGRNVLPSYLQNTIPKDAEVKVTRLSPSQSREFLEEKLEKKNLNSHQILLLEEKAEGHPLYLRYLTRYILEADDPEDISDFIEHIPVIGGHIEVYYSNIWDRISKNAGESSLAATLARTRIPLHKDRLYSLMNSTEKAAFPQALKNIQHLLKDSTELNIYHTSFSDFIKERTEPQNAEIHDTIARYCLDNPDTHFSVSEKIYHLLHGNFNNRTKAPELCDQQWIDDCANWNVTPDVVLDDIRFCVKQAAINGKPHQVIALLLLAQRVNFRYNYLLKENAYFLVRALLAMEKPEEALRYVVRNKSLIVTDGDALSLLRLFYEYGFNPQAESLLQVINDKCKTYLDISNTGTFNAYINLKFDAITLSSNTDLRSSKEELIFIMDHILEMLRLSNNPPDVISGLKNEIYAYDFGYMIYRFGEESGNMVEDTGKRYTLNADFSTTIAMSIQKYTKFEQDSIFEKNDTAVLTWVKQLELSIATYGYHPKYSDLILGVLINYSKNTSLVSEIIKTKYPTEKILKFREDNGVDINRNAVAEYGLYSECQGWINYDKSLPIQSAITPRNWENAITQRLRAIFFLRGKAKRLKAENDDSGIQLLLPELEHLIKNLPPKLTNRVLWERSYNIPEGLYPLAYAYLTNFICNFFPDHIERLIPLMIENPGYQLGLYSEGYADSLFAMAQELYKIGKQDKHLFRIAKIAEQHVTSTVENRLERNEYLLRLVEIYALLDNKDKSDMVFKEMIASSMGPSWYKEAQLSIINTAVSNIKPDPEQSNTLPRFAAHLHHASGEMTFQRYVKQHQEALIGNLASVNRLDAAITYFKRMLIPDYSQILENAETGPTDMPIKGLGYLSGARGIEEQSGIKELIENLDYRNSMVSWALLELWLPGDTRYMSDYTEMQAKILNHAQGTDNKVLKTLYARTIRFLKYEVAQEYKNEYVENLSAWLSEENRTGLNTLLTINGFKKLPQNKTRKVPGHTIGEKSPLYPLVVAKSKALEYLEMENKSGARKVIIEGLLNVQKERYSIFGNVYSHHIEELRNLLKLAYSNPEELLKELNQILFDEGYDEPWIIANNLIKLIGSDIGEHEKKLTLNAVESHIAFMLRTPIKVPEKYSFLNAFESSADQEDTLLDLLIWFLNHPELIIKNRSIELLVWLSLEKPEKIIPVLATEICKQGYQLSKELAAAILHQTAVTNPRLFWENFEKCLEIVKVKLFPTPHFMVVNSVIESLEVINASGIADTNAHLSELLSLFNCPEHSGVDFYLEEEYLGSISDELEELESLGILDGKFAKSFITLVKDTAPLSMDEITRVSEYVNRSFNDRFDISVVPEIETLLRYALNSTIVAFVGLDKRKDVAKILRYYQPTFPENKLTGSPAFSFELNNLIKKICSGQPFSIGSILGTDILILHYLFEKISRPHLPTIDTEESLEIVAFAIPKTVKLDEDIDPNELGFHSNQYPEHPGTSQKDMPLALVLTADQQKVTGSDHVPGVCSQNVSSVFGSETLKSIRYNYWRDGRNWEPQQLGVPGKYGSCISIGLNSQEKSILNYNLIWMVKYGYSVSIVDVFNNRVITEW